MRNRARGLYRLILTSTVVLGTLPIFAQTIISGKVLSSYDKAPIPNAVVSIVNTSHNTQTKANGTFRFEDLDTFPSTIRVWSPGYYEAIVEVLGRTEFEVTLISEGRIKYDNVIDGAFSEKNSAYLQSTDYRAGAIGIENVLVGEMAGLRITNKSGMVSEGGTINFRGARSFEADNSPLIVIDGIPFLPDATNSPIIGAYSRGILSAINVNDIKSVRLLKGADAARYGSLGSNGVLSLETSSSLDLQTVIEFKGNYGVAHNFRTIPVLGVSDYKSYLGNVGMTEYDDMGQLLNNFPFLRDDPNYFYNYLYNNTTDWQDLIYRNAFVTDNHLRVKGGDAVAKYDLSLGVLNQNGALDQTRNTRYSTRMNTTVALGAKFDLNAAMGLTYATSKLQEQGISRETNPVLAAMYRAPVLSPYKKDRDNNLLPDYDAIGYFGVTNPVALLNDGNVSSDIYDVFVNANLIYKASANLRFTGTVGLFSNYTRQALFVPGLSSGTVAPLEGGIALNTARAGEGQTSNIFLGVNTLYDKTFGQDVWQIGGGIQSIMSSQEYDAGSGRNTSSDFYRTLNYTNAAGRMFWGYSEKWNWLSFYGFSSYNFRNLVKVDASLNVDGSSVSGNTANRFGLFPAADVSFLMSNYGGIKDVESINSLILKLGYSKTGNSRFSSKLSKSYYSSQLYRQLAGVVVGNIPNTGIQWEDNQNVQANLIFSGFDRKFNLNVGYYYSKSSNLLNMFPVSPIAGIDRVYINGGQIDNHGLEVDLNLSVLDNRTWSLAIGGNISTLNSTVKQLVGNSSLIVDQPDEVQRINMVGQSPFSFYGYEFMGVISSQAEAQAHNLTDFRTQAFEAGDALFNDVNQDGVIDKQDKQLLGSSLPKLFGGGSVSLRYKQFNLQGYMSYSQGGRMYNGLRRSLESQDGWANQSEATLRRWQADGQVTDIPKVQYGDPMENARFSSRWIEDASYLRLENLIFSYSISKSRIKALSNSEWYIAGENLFTWTNYLGLDPVTEYANQVEYTGLDYGKVALPRTFKIGVNIKL
ncbi:SusC/RagA family TonB-linked outer membrane protein [Sphingobacterium olei]|uniref:SusC/RagA family TonB-linked outer membrane protein n=1 Tax=Sphingobacterium olei TaxID=2571155 RepID=A0A4U0P1I6_9SPHI|nr:SusC/RagA family TonB-linked outer membrane protein [Sphingobacterium olei]TJZ61131.1 SusC/RagA family TonB-linked outer membrane protein [Sphingobacterium olei]